MFALNFSYKLITSKQREKPFNFNKPYTPVLLKAQSTFFRVENFAINLVLESRLYSVLSNI